MLPDRNSDTAGIVALALSFHDAPARHADLLHGWAPLPPGVSVLLRLAGGSEPDPHHAALAPAAELKAAALFFIEQVLFRHGGSHYRVLGLEPGAAPELIKEHHRLLMRVFHPDRENRTDDWESAFATRINLAYTCLRNPDARRDYDATLKRATPAAKPPAVRRAVRTPKSASAFSRIGGPQSLLQRYLPQWILGGTALAAFMVVGAVYLNNPVMPPEPSHTARLPEEPLQRRTGSGEPAGLKVNAVADIPDVLTEPIEVAGHEMALEPEMVLEPRMAAEPVVAAESKIEAAPKTRGSFSPTMLAVAAPAVPPRQAPPLAAPPPRQAPPPVATRPPMPAAVKRPPLNENRKPPVQAVMASAVASPVPAQPMVTPMKMAAALAPIPPMQPEPPTVQPAQPEPRAAEAVRPPLLDPNATLARFVSSYERGDPQAFMALFDEVAIGGSGGKSRIRREHESLFKTTDLRHISIDGMAWAREGDWIRGVGNYRRTLMRKGELKLSTESGVIRIDLMRRGDQALIMGLDYLPEGRS